MRSSSQKLSDLIIQHKILSLKYANNQSKAAQLVLNGHQKAIRVALYSALLDMPGSVWLPGFSKSLAAAMQPVFLQAFIDSISAVNDELPDFIDHELEFLTRAMNQSIPGEITALAPVRSPAAKAVTKAIRSMPVMGMTLAQTPASLAQSAVKMMDNTVKAAFNTGKKPLQIIDEVTPLNSTFFNRQRTNVAAVVTTHIGASGSEARDAFMQENDHLIRCRQWVSTLDSHTTPMCIVRDLLQYTLQTPVEPIGHDIPYGAGPGKLHYGCRSVETIVLKSAAEVAPDADLSQQTRASMNGQVPQNQSYSEWIAKQSDYVQEQALGIQRAALVKSGKVKVPSLFSNTGEMIPLSELKKRVAALQ